MKTIRVAAAVLNQTPMDWPGNFRRIITAIDQARQQNASILCLPELCITGYGCEDMFHAPAVPETAMRVLQHVLPHTLGMVVSVGLPLMERNAVFNVACLLVDGKIAGAAAKQFLAGDGIHYEPRWFKAWPAEVVTHVPILGQTVPVGDICFDVGGVGIGFEICEDAWVAKRPGGALARQGVDVILNPSASHFAFGKIDVRRRLVQEGSRAFGVTYVYANLLGNEAGRAIYDGGAMIASAGQLHREGQRFGYGESGVIAATIDLAATRALQARSVSYEPELVPGPRCVAVPFTFTAAVRTLEKPVAPAWETGPFRKEEEFARAEAMALFDYLRKSRAEGFVVSLSGGADSSAVACLVALMVDFAVAELGVAGVIDRLSHVRGIANCDSGRSIVGRLLTCVYQGTRNSSDTTANAAETLARAIGAEFIRLDVDPLVQGYVQLAEYAIGRPLDWQADDVALQNIQARARGPGVWMIANVKNALLLATSNRSEAAVGYATMDGDTCGGLSPVAGIDKAFLRHWLRWLETTGPADHRPIAALALVNEQQPTAELRPLASGQTDEADLMPYDVLDAIERSAIRDKLTPADVLEVLRLQFTNHPPAQLAGWVDRFFRLWCRNQWKRERYAPSFHLDDENLDPKTWCRFPILSGGFETELAELQQAEHH